MAYFMVQLKQVEFIQIHILIPAGISCLSRDNILPSQLIPDHFIINEVVLKVFFFKFVL